MHHTGDVVPGAGVVPLRHVQRIGGSLVVVVRAGGHLTIMWENTSRANATETNPAKVAT